MTGLTGIPADAATTSDPVAQRLEEALGQLEEARPFAKARPQAAALEACRRMLLQPDGLERLYVLSPRLDRAGIFAGTDWAEPAALVPSLVRSTLDHGNRATVLLDCLSSLRLLAVARGDVEHPAVSAEQARHFLTQVLALNLHRLSAAPSESDRTRLGPMADAVQGLLTFLLQHIGFRDILGSLVEEIWRILEQRPIRVDNVKAMVTQIAVALADGHRDLGETRLGADRLISALFGPTQECRDDPGLATYVERLASMDNGALQQEAVGFARAMHDVGLVSDYHAVFLRWLLDEGRESLVPAALGLSSTGLDAFRTYQDLVVRLLREAVHPETAQAVYGMALLLERGSLYDPSVAPALWRQLGLEPSAATSAALAAAFGESLPARVHLLAGVLSLLGQPLGVGQGNNPTCQAARAISMWALGDPGYLLHLTAHAARMDRVVMPFEGHPLDSAILPTGLARTVPLDTDPVSVVLVPHLDRIYQEMGRLCAQRGEDPHRWINPEFHGWWVGRGFAIAVDVATGGLHDHDSFLRRFYASYHPLHNGNQPLIHPQPAGVAVTDSLSQFVGWHAVTLLRVALDREGTMRVYFYNPNNDSGQDWGGDVVVSTSGHGERFGEGSLPFVQMASRLYIFHDHPLQSDPERATPAPPSEIEEAGRMARESWARDRS